MDNIKHAGIYSFSWHETCEQYNDCKNEACEWLLVQGNNEYKNETCKWLLAVIVTAYNVQGNRREYT